ncbi:MAG: M28 family peptidase [Trueperaceae bacterium]
MLHVKHLAVGIGPRGSTTDAEREAADYVAGVLERAGLQTTIEPFVSTVSGWRPFAVAALVALAATVVFVLAGRSLAAVLGVIMLAATLSVFLEMYFRPNLLRPFIGKGRSQNVLAKVPAAKGTAPAAGAAAPQRVVLVAHIDTHRTPWVFTSPGRLAFFKSMTTLGVAAFVLCALLFLAFAVTGAEWLRYVALALTPVHLIVLGLTLQPDTTPFTAGANDNATGVGVLLNLGERLAKEPLANTEVWLLASGCEEVGSVGAQAFLKRHRHELEGAQAISIDNVGGAGAGVCYTSVEGMVIPLKPSQRLFALAEELRAQHPELNAYSLPYTTLHTDATCFMAAGVPSLSFVGLTPDGTIPNWHVASDVYENVDPATVEKTEEFVWRLLRRLDEQGPS